MYRDSIQEWITIITWTWCSFYSYIHFFITHLVHLEYTQVRQRNFILIHNRFLPAFLFYAFSFLHMFSLQNHVSNVFQIYYKLVFPNDTPGAENTLVTLFSCISAFIFCESTPLSSMWTITSANLNTRTASPLYACRLSLKRQHSGDTIITWRRWLGNKEAKVRQSLSQYLSRQRVDP